MAESAVYIMMAAATAVSVVSAQQTAKGNEAALDYQARQQEQRAGQERAASQREAQEHRRQGQIMISRAQALTGGGSTDDGALDAIGDIAAQSEYNALTAIYEGEERGLGREMQATGFRMQGDAGRRAANWQSASSVFSAGSSMYGKYGNGGFGGSGTGGYASESWRTTGNGMPG